MQCSAGVHPAGFNVPVVPLKTNHIHIFRYPRIQILRVMLVDVQCQQDNLTHSQRQHGAVQGHRTYPSFAVKPYHLYPLLVLLQFDCKISRDSCTGVAGDAAEGKEQALCAVSPLVLTEERVVDRAVADHHQFFEATRWKEVSSSCAKRSNRCDQLCSNNCRRDQFARERLKSDRGLSTGPLIKANVVGVLVGCPYN